MARKFFLAISLRLDILSLRTVLKRHSLILAQKFGCLLHLKVKLLLSDV